MLGQVIETDRLLIRHFTLDDAAAFLPLVSQPDVLRYTGEAPLTSVSEAVELLRSRTLQDYKTRGYGRMACIEKATARLIGFAGLKFLKDLGETDVGYRLLPNAWGKGYATESASAIMAVQPRAFGLERIIGLVERENQRSVRVLKKLGLTFERPVKVEDHGDLDQYAIRLGPER